MVLAAADPSLARRVSPDLPDLVAEAAFAARREQARGLSDVLLRRTRLGLLDARGLAPAASGGAAVVAAAMGRELGWDAARVESELADWRRTAAAEGLVPAAAPAAEPEAA